jgi:membrane protease YdiL (CAAX protease family)
MHWIVVRPGDGRVRAGWRYLIFLVALALAGVVCSAMIRLLSLPPMRTGDGVLRPGSLFLRGLLVTVAVVVVNAVLMRLVERRPLSTVGLPLEAPWVRGLATGLAFGATPVAVLVVVLGAAGHAQVSLAPVSLTSFWTSWLPTVLGLALVSSLEELILRGYGLQLLAEAGGRWMAALLTGALFGFMHVENPGANVAGLVNTAANAILLAWLVMRTGSLWMACGYHVGWNVAGAPLLGMRLSGLDHSGGLLVTRLTGPDWLTGGSYGFEGSVLVGLIEFVVLGLVVAAAPRLPGHPDLVRYFGPGRRPT